MMKRLFYLSALLLALLIAAVCTFQYLQDTLYHRMMNDPEAEDSWGRYESLAEIRTRLTSAAPYMTIAAVVLGLTCALQDHGMLRRGNHVLLGLACMHLLLILCLYMGSGSRVDLAELLIVFVDCWSVGLMVYLPIYAVGWLTKNL